MMAANIVQDISCVASASEPLTWLGLTHVTTILRIMSGGASAHFVAPESGFRAGDADHDDADQDEAD